MNTTPRPIEVGDRFEDEDRRSGDRVIEIVKVGPGDNYRYVTRVNTLAPWTVTSRNRVLLGRRISGHTLRTRWLRVTR